MSQLGQDSFINYRRRVGDKSTISWDCAQVWSGAEHLGGDLAGWQHQGRRFPQLPRTRSWALGTFPLFRASQGWGRRADGVFQLVQRRAGMPANSFAAAAGSRVSATSEVSS